mmetsp:Transcript_40131/g.99329  ORF Transcript_40131/g.99329 Transcript_40131/m.99329 type:complete len:254 (-) Transcript_40131:891-1652(-)
MRSEMVANILAVAPSSTTLTMDTFCEEPTARNSKRWPPYGKGDVRLRSSAGACTMGSRSTPRFTGVVYGLYSDTLPFMNSVRYAVICLPRYVEITEGGASMAPRRKSLPGEAMDRRMRSPYSLTAATMAAITTGKISGLPERLVMSAGLSSCTPSSVEMDQLLCLPLPFTPWNGFSCSRHARPCFSATSSQICITTRFWSVCVMTLPNSGANSYWLGATSRWRVLSGMPSLKHSCWISAMHFSTWPCVLMGAM